MVFKSAYFVELRIDYWPAKFRSCRVSGSSFTDRFEKNKTMTLFIMTSFIISGLGFETRTLEAINVPSLRQFNYLDRILRTQL